jgi:threonine/homoserine/homoserine lactone efflux protein
MPDASTLVLFIAACVVLLITPGPAVLYIVTRSIDQGRAAGVLSALGISLGTLVHVLAAALGLSALLVSSVMALNVVKYLGAAYLIMIGIRTLLTPAKPHTSVPLTPLPRRIIFWQGMVVNVLNVKLALFILAFLPQFIDPTRSVAPQILLLGGILVVLGFVNDSLYALTSGTLGGWLKRSPAFLQVQRYVAGVSYIGLGITAALTGSSKQ